MELKNIEQENLEQSSTGPQNMEQFYDVVIIGGGPAGLTAALYLARARYRVVVLEKEQFGGQITITAEVVNYPGIERTSGTALTEAMRRQAQSFGAEFLLAEAEELLCSGEIKKVRTSRGELSCFGILLATGAHPRMIGFQGEADFRGHGVAYCATCDGEFFTGKDVFVVGGGFAAAEESVFLTKYARHVTILIREDDFTCAKATADGARNHENITVRTNVEVVKVEGDSALRLLQYKNTKTGEITEYRPPEGDTFGVFVFAGYEPATALVKGIVPLNPQGYVITNEALQTNVEGLYAAGDVCVKNLRQVVTAVGDGALAATELERYAAAMQEKTGIHPTQPVTRISGGQKSPKKSSSEENVQENTLFSQDMLDQLQMVFDRMKQPLILKLFLDQRPVSKELRSYMESLAALTEKLSVEISKDQEEEMPCVRICLPDGTKTGLAFHGVPGGHEFTSFVMGLYNAAGPGQRLEPEVQKKIQQINRPVHLKIMVSLSCTMCPELVMAAQRIAAENKLVTTDVYDLNHFPDMKEQYRVMSVPCMVINNNAPVFGKKNIRQLTELLESIL